MHRPLPAAAFLVALGLAACTEPPRPGVSLYRAVHSGDLEQVKRHLYWKTEINRADVNGDFPLHVAARTGGVTIAEALLAHGADPVAADAAGRTPLEVALANGRTQVALLLIEHRVPLDPQDMLLRMIRAGVSDRDVFNFLVRRGADVNLAGAQRQPPLHIAIATGRLGPVSRLIAFGADSNRPDGQGRFPLDLALARPDSRRGDGRAIIELLQRNGARAETTEGSRPPAPQRTRQ